MDRGKFKQEMIAREQGFDWDSAEEFAEVPGGGVIVVVVVSVLSIFGILAGIAFGLLALY